MCGIAGIFPYRVDGAPVNALELQAIRDRMIERGPDGFGLWVSEDRSIGLAHRRLAIIDLSDAGAQPMLDNETGSRIVFNGEIYNYQGLRSDLEVAGHTFRSNSDTEVLLKLYGVYGKEMLLKLRGMYAFAIWDEFNQGIFLARDPFGIKPLYLADDGNTLRFASQVKALLAGGCIDTSPSPAGHVGFFLWGFVPEPFTLYQSIRALPAGTSLWIDRASKKARYSFFDLAEELATAEQSQEPSSPTKARELLSAALLDSVRYHLIADVPVGVFLSAGLDSSTITALVKEAAVKELRTFTLGFKEFIGTENDEVPLAETVARHYGAIHHTQWVCKENFASDVEDLLQAMDQPSIDGVNSYFVCKAAHEVGLKVVLSGLGGDELFAGYSYFRSIPKMVRWLHPFSAVPGLGRGIRKIAAPLLKHVTSPKAASLFEYGGDYAGAYFLRRALYMPWEIVEFLDRDFFKKGWDQLNTLPTLRQTIHNLKRDRTKISALETSWYMNSQLLRDSDWASMAHSLELRVPLVDIVLFRTVARLVGAGNAPTKQDMAAAPARPLPQVVLNKHKTGFSIPVQTWLMDDQPKAFCDRVQGLRPWADRIYGAFT